MNAQLKPTTGFRSFLKFEGKKKEKNAK